MIQSAVNLQLEGLVEKFASKKKFLHSLLIQKKKYSINKLLKKAMKKRFLKCLELNLTDIDIQFKKGQIQFGFYYQNNTKYDHESFRELCMSDGARYYS